MEIKVNTEKHKMVLHQDFLTGEHEGYKFTLTSGAGCGNPYLGLTVKCIETGDHIWESIDTQKILEQWLDEKIKILNKRKKSESTSKRVAET